MFVHKKINQIICFIIVFIFAILINNYYGKIGIHPTDSFSHLDSSYSILVGEHPIKNVWVMSGILIDYIQAFFFKLFGNNFNALIYHASFFNALISLSLFFVLFKNNLSLALSTIISCCVAILCYPVAGTPFPYQHSFILSLVSLLIFFQCVNSDKKIYWFLLPIFMFLSFLSMQLPSGLINLILIIACIGYMVVFRDKRSFFFFILGCLTCFLALTSYFFIIKIPIQDFVLQYILFPLSVGDGRVLGDSEAFYGAKLSNRFTLRGVVGHFKFIHLIWIIMCFFIIKNFKNIEKTKKIKLVLINATLILSSISFVFHQLITANQTFIFSLIPFMGGLLYLLMEKEYKTSSYTRIAILLIVLFSTYKYHFEYNEKRKFMDLQSANFDISVDAKLLHSKFKGLRWITPHYISNPHEEIKLIKEALDIITKDKDNIMVITHYQFFSFLTEKKIHIPNRWYYLGNNTFPSNNSNPYFKDYTKFFMRKILENKIDRIYILQSVKNEMTIDNFKSHLINVCFESKQISSVFSLHDLKKCD